MALIEVLGGSPILLMLVIAIVSLLVGSFLNVVVYRLPIMMQKRWQQECAELEKENLDDIPAVFNLSVPRSACPNCGHKITALENIPVISYLFLRGKCRGCKTPISIQYPLVEILTAVLSVIIVWHFGFSWQTLAGVFFTWVLIALANIDLETLLLPDSITLPLLWVGLLLNVFGVFTDLQSAVLGAVFGYLSLWSVFHLFKFVTGKEGMGYGDFKLLAALGAWLGWQSLFVIVILSSLIGAVAGGIYLALRKEKSRPIPFGPFLAAAGWVAMLWGDELLHGYLKFSGME